MSTEQMKEACTARLFHVLEIVGPAYQRGAYCEAQRAFRRAGGWSGRPLHLVMGVVLVVVRGDAVAGGRDGVGAVRCAARPCGLGEIPSAHG